MEPAADVAVEQRRDDPAGDRSADDREAQLEAADARVEDRAGMLGEVRRMEEHVAEPAADDRTRHDAEDDEQEIVGAEAHRPGADRGQRDPEEDRGRDPEGLPANDPIAKMEIRVEIEGDDGERHGRSVPTGRVGPSGGLARACNQPNRSRRLCQLADTWRVVLTLTAESATRRSSGHRSRLWGR